MGSLSLIDAVPTHSLFRSGVYCCRALSMACLGLANSSAGAGSGSDIDDCSEFRGGDSYERSISAWIGRRGVWGWSPRHLSH